MRTIQMGRCPEPFRVTWKQKTPRAALVEGRMSPPMPCFDGAQHWVVAADRESSPVGKSLALHEAADLIEQAGAGGLVLEDHVVAAVERDET